jgi:hypothetical protein
MPTQPSMRSVGYTGSIIEYAQPALMMPMMAMTTGGERWP